MLLCGEQSVSDLGGNSSATSAPNGPSRRTRDSSVSPSTNSMA